MPRHRRRSGPSRFFLPAALGAIALSAAGSVIVGTLFRPSPAGAVEAVQGGPGPSAGAVSSRETGAETWPTDPDQRATSIDPLIDAAPGFGGSSIEARDDAATHPGPPPLAELSAYRWPLPNGRITLPFGPSRWGSRVVAGEPFHDGLDLATFCGDRIVAAHDGTILAAGRPYDTQMGWIGDLQPYLDRLEAESLWSTLPIVIVIDDGNGYRSLYAHLSKTVVKKGDTVKAGDLIGYEGRTGRASGCHLHYGLFSPLETARFGIDPGVVERMLLPPWQTARVDPLLVLPARRSGESTPRAWPSYEGTSGKEPFAE